MTRPPSEDHCAIVDLLARGAWALDTGDAGDYARCFLPAGELVDFRRRPVETARGITAIRALAERWYAETSLRRQHHIGQLAFAPDPLDRGDHWRVRAYVFLVECLSPAGCALGWAGYYDDVVCRNGEGWLVRTREVRPWEGAVLANFEDPRG
ncbi:MAG TPA: nuclear transport factor 2 family protein [Solirubrobacteraceae bacterium]|nr:nuclear transport factor 2 family protein [Solirubrobacteraceae bacterium]